MSEKQEVVEGGNYEISYVTVDPKQEELRIDKYLMGKLEGVTRNKVQESIKTEKIVVNDKAIKVNYKVKPNDVIKVMTYRNPEYTGQVIPQDIPLDIRYEDDHVMIVHKPNGLVVHPGVGNPNGTLVNGIMHHLNGQDIPVKEGNDSDRPGIVHRIDKDTSGLMVVCKKEQALSHLGEQFFHHTIDRKYYALVWGDLEQDEGTINMNVARDPNNHLLVRAYPDGSRGKHAITHYKVIERLYYVTLVECTLETGRTHQIRVHFKELGHPLFSDTRYGGGRIVKGTVYTKYRQFVENCFKLMPRQALHAKSLGFTHPDTEERMFFESELPEDFQACLDKWRAYVLHKKQF